MHPWCRFGLAHAEQTAMEQVRGMLFEVDQNREEPSSGVGTGQGREVVERRACRRRPCRVQVAI